MKARRVFVQLEIETAASLKELRSRHYWILGSGGEVLQAQANVARSVKAKKARRKA